METGFLKSGTGSFAAVWILAAAALLGAARMGGGLQEETIVKEDGNPGFSDRPDGGHCGGDSGEEWKGICPAEACKNSGEKNR
ncbi:MAG: hypothetical protein ACLUD8_06390 [Clostridium sp.]